MSDDKTERYLFERAIFRLEAFSMFLTIYTLAGLKVTEINFLGTKADLDSPLIITIFLWVTWAILTFRYTIEFRQTIPRSERDIIRKSSDSTWVRLYTKRLKKIAEPKAQRIAQDLNVKARHGCALFSFKGVDPGRIYHRKATAYFSTPRIPETDLDHEIFIPYGLTARLADHFPAIWGRWTETRLWPDHVIPWIVAIIPVTIPVTAMIRNHF